MTLLGNLSLWLTLLLGAWGAAAGALGVLHGRPDLARSAQRAGQATAVALAAAVGALGVAVFRTDFNVAYVAAHAGRAVSGLSRWAVLYAGPQGVALVYATALAVAAVATAGLDSRVEGLRRAVMSGAVTCVAAALVFVVNPFTRLPFTPVDGAGLHPALQQVSAALGTLLWLLAYAALAVPFAGAVAGLAARRVEPRWVRHAHRWVLVAWLLLSAGVLLRARAAYLEPGTPDWWLTRPAMAGGLLVWLAVTVMLHGTAAELRRGGFPRWSLAGAVGSWALAVLATVTVTAEATRPWAPALALAAVLAAGFVWRYGRPVGGSGGGPETYGPSGLRSRRAAAHVAHAGGVVLAVGCAGAAWHSGARVELLPAGTTTIAGTFGRRYDLTYLGTSRYERGNQIVTAATIQLSRAGRRIGVRRAEELLYVDVMGRQVAGPRSRVALWGGVAEDVRVELIEARDADETVVLRVARIPLAAYVWVGGGLLLLGGLLAVVGLFTKPSRARR